LFEIRYANESDKTFWFSIDKRMSDNEFTSKARDKRTYIISNCEKPIGIMRYNIFWCNTPFLDLIYIDEASQNKGFGMHAMKHWENEMLSLGYKLVMTSTRSDEQAQHFYRKIGYIDSGCLVLSKEPAEIFFVKYFDDILSEGA